MNLISSQDFLTFQVMKKIFKSLIVKIKQMNNNSILVKMDRYTAGLYIFGSFINFRFQKWLRATRPLSIVLVEVAYSRDYATSSARFFFQIMLGFENYATFS